MSIVTALAPRPDETLVDIGTGTATLARMLAPHCARVLAIERDRDLVRALAADGLAPNITVLEADAVGFDYAATALAGPTALVGNLPYQITGRLLRAILTPPVRWRTAVVMLQAEVAARLLASPRGDDWGVLSIFTQAACTVTRVCTASAGCFHPAPRVSSAVVQLTPREIPLATDGGIFSRVVHAVFAVRRKTLRNGLTSVVGRDAAETACVRAGIDPGARPETLSIVQLAALSDACAALARPVTQGD